MGKRIILFILTIPFLALLTIYLIIQRTPLGLIGGIFLGILLIKIDTWILEGEQKGNYKSFLNDKFQLHKVFK